MWEGLIPPLCSLDNIIVNRFYLSLLRNEGLLLQPSQVVPHLHEETLLTLPLLFRMIAVGIVNRTMDANRHLTKTQPHHHEMILAAVQSHVKLIEG